MELLIGAGSAREKRLRCPGGSDGWTHLVTLDHEASHHPDVVANLDQSLPFAADTFDEIHGYHILEHLGRQGDAASWFRLWDELARISKVGAYFFGLVPSWKSIWAWGDPSHTRIVNEGTITFLDRACYGQVGSTTMSDFRSSYKSDWRVVDYSYAGEEFQFVLQLRGKEGVNSGI